jgi:hypothetical protein
MFLIAVSRNGIFLGTILFRGLVGNLPFSADCEPPLFSDDILQRLASRLKDGEVEGQVDGCQWNLQDLESLVWRPTAYAGRPKGEE